MERYTVSQSLVFTSRKEKIARVAVESVSEAAPDSVNLGYFSDLPGGEQENYLNIE